MGKSEGPAIQGPRQGKPSPGGIVVLLQAERAAVGCLLANLNEMHFKIMLVETQICSGAKNQ